eukprot:6481357-Amphidinium_carterae.1
MSFCSSMFLLKEAHHTTSIRSLVLDGGQAVSKATADSELRLCDIHGEVACASGAAALHVELTRLS